MLATLTGAPGGIVAELQQHMREATRCSRSTSGAWAIVIETVNVDGDDVGGRWCLVHVTSAGLRSSVCPDTTLTAGGGRTLWRKPCATSTETSVRIS